MLDQNCTQDFKYQIWLDFKKKFLVRVLMITVFEKNHLFRQWTKRCKNTIVQIMNLLNKTIYIRENGNLNQTLKTKTDYPV